jgi:hypothetical protein
MGRIASDTVGEEQEYYLSGLGARRVGDVVGGARSKSTIGRTAVVGRCSQDFPSLGALCVGCCHVVVEQADRATRYAHLRSSAKDYGRVAH